MKTTLSGKSQAAVESVKILPNVQGDVWVALYAFVYDTVTYEVPIIAGSYKDLTEDDVSEILVARAFLDMARTQFLAWVTLKEKH